MRIRTIKPEFFTHEELYELERESGVPVRLGYAGLWCAADREGRFKWEPRRLGVSILPYDNIDFSRVLDACLTRGLLVKYRVGDAWFGAIPSWKKHQFVNAREAASQLPAIDQASEVYDACLTRASRVDDACSKERKGKERKEEGREGGVGGNGRDGKAALPGFGPEFDAAVTKTKKQNLTDAEWLAQLKADVTFSHVDIDFEHGKMLLWCQNRRKKPTRLRFLNWIGRIEKPMGKVFVKSEQQRRAEEAGL